MSETPIYSDDYVQMWKMVEESFDRLCSIWDDIGVHSSSSRDELKRNYIQSCKTALSVHLENVVREEESVCKVYFLYCSIEKRSSNHLKRRNKS